MTSIFIDTSAFIAFLRQDDPDHDPANRLLQYIKDTHYLAFTTDYILDETYTGLLTKEGYHLAMEFDKQFSKGLWQIERITEVRFLEAKKVFRKFNKDKQWSFTDCTSYVVMKELKIASVFTFDDHFKQMGFKPLSSSR